MRNAVSRHLAETDPGDKYQPCYQGTLVYDRASDGAWVMCHAFNVHKVTPLSLFDLVRFKRPDRMVRSYPTKILTRIDFDDRYATDLEHLGWVYRPHYEAMRRDYRQHRPFVVWGRASLILKRLADFCSRPFLGRPPTDQERYLYWRKEGRWFWGEPSDMEWRAVSGLPLWDWQMPFLRDYYRDEEVTDRLRILVWRRYRAWPWGKPASMEYRPTPAEEEWIMSVKNCPTGY